MLALAEDSVVAIGKFEIETEKLQRNLENIPKEDQEGKYKAALDKLKQSIYDTVPHVVEEIVLPDFIFDESKEGREVMDTVYREWKEIAGGLGYLHDLILDKKRFYTEIDKAKFSLQKGTYLDYWASHCTCPNGIYYNDILNMQWNGKWWSDIFENHNLRSLPPTRELFMKDQEELQKIRAQHLLL